MELTATAFASQRLRILVRVKISLILICLLGTGFGLRLAGSSEARIQAAKTQISSFKTALEMFQVDNGFYPTTDQGLEALVEMPENATNWTKPYLGIIPLDPWNNPYSYRYPATYNTNTFDIYSAGPDGISNSRGNDPDDINNWNSSFRMSVEEFEAMFPPKYEKRVFVVVGIVGVGMLLLFIRWFRGGAI